VKDPSVFQGMRTEAIVNVAEVSICSANIAAWLRFNGEPHTGGHLVVAGLNALRREGASLNFSAAKKKEKGWTSSVFLFFVFCF
jgi:hypothetical protein